FHSPPPTEIYTLSLHDALPISWHGSSGLLAPREGSRLAADHRAIAARPVCPRCSCQSRRASRAGPVSEPLPLSAAPLCRSAPRRDRKSTRLNSSHLVISYAVFC